MLKKIVLVLGMLACLVVPAAAADAGLPALPSDYSQVTYHYWAAIDVGSGIDLYVCGAPIYVDGSLSAFTGGYRKYSLNSTSWLFKSSGSSLFVATTDFLASSNDIYKGGSVFFMHRPLTRPYILAGTTVTAVQALPGSIWDQLLEVLPTGLTLLSMALVVSLIVLIPRRIGLS